MNRRGFTLVELLVTISILAIAATLSSNFIVQTYKDFRLSQQMTTQQQEAMLAINRLTDDIRQATGIDAYSASSLTMYRFVGNDPNPYKIVYTLSQTALTRTQTPPSGVPPSLTYPANTSSTTTIAQHISAGLSIFLGYNEANEILTIGDRSGLRAIGVTLSVDIQPNQDPKPYVISSQAAMRNFKTN